MSVSVAVLVVAVPPRLRLRPRLRPSRIGIGTTRRDSYMPFACLSLSLILVLSRSLLSLPTCLSLRLVDCLRSLAYSRSTHRHTIVRPQSSPDNANEHAPRPLAHPTASVPIISVQASLP